MLSTATQNLINMVVVIGVSGAVLFALLAARHSGRADDSRIQRYGRSQPMTD
jgi:hypothetical protein